MKSVLLVIYILFLCTPCVLGGSKKKPHSHQGSLTPYDGKHIPYSISKAENEKLESGQPVSIKPKYAPSFSSSKFSK